MLKPPGIPPVVAASNMGCWKWQGHVSFTNGGGVSLQTDVKWTRASGTTSPLTVQYAPEGTTSWSVVAPPDCNAKGTAALPPALSSLISFNFAPKDSPFARTYYGVGGVPISACGGTASFPWFTMPTLPINGENAISRFVKVSADGKTMDGSFSFPQNPAVWTWHFESQRQ